MTKLEEEEVPSPSTSSVEREYAQDATTSLVVATDASRGESKRGPTTTQTKTEFQPFFSQLIFEVEETWKGIRRTMVRTMDNLQAKVAELDDLLQEGPGESDTKSEPPFLQDYKSNTGAEKNWFSCGADECKNVTCEHTRVRMNADDNIKYVPPLPCLLFHLRARTRGCGGRARHKNDG
jgi:hypothetical protein